MSSDPEWFDEPENELEDNEYPDEDDFDDDDFNDDDFNDDESTETVPCPECGAEVYEDAVCCPVCGTYITADNSIWSGRPGWWILLGLLGILAVVVVLAGI